MRIIAGRLRHRVLLANPGNVTRPITDRVKETLFARLGDSVKGLKILDVFSGTGTLGLEALSRGSASVVFIDNDRVACDLLRKNIAALKVQDVTICWQTDGLRSSYRPKSEMEVSPFDLIFFDPPYKIVPDLTEGSPMYRALERLARPDVSSPNSRLVFRAPERVEIRLPPVWEPAWNFVMSNMDVRVFRRSPDPAATAVS